MRYAEPLGSTYASIPTAIPERAIPGDVVDLLAVGELIDDTMRPGHFSVAFELSVNWIAAKSETIPWELFRGRLLDASQTREQKTFLSWQVTQEVDGQLASEPLISVKLDVHERQIHVTRGLYVYAWEGYGSGGGVIESREVKKWTRELVGTIILSEFGDLESVRDELICLIWQAIVGTSRLPLTSVEAPVPAFSFGQLHYVYRADAGDYPSTSSEYLWTTSVTAGAGEVEKAKLVEFIFRANSIPQLLPLLEQHGAEILSPPIWRAIFNGVSLSPYTQFVERALTAIRLGMEHEKQIDFHSHLLTRLGRHMTAYDLVTFHHRGANYPDALLLDAAIKYYLTSASDSEAFMGSEPKARFRRRALRQGCLMRWRYEGLPVPDAPTSPGENARVTPGSHPRVPEEQLAQTMRRRRLLFQDEPLRELIANVGEDAVHLATRFEIRARLGAALEQSVGDLANLDERIEMGLGLFIDRPLGYGKEVGEPDLTPMLAHEAFSPSLARRRWQELKKLCAELSIPFDSALDDRFENGPWPTGLSHAELAECPRPTAALSDLRKVASDFVILRTMPRGLAEFWTYFNWQTLRERFAMQYLNGPEIQLLVQASNEKNAPVLAVYDAKFRRRLEMVVDVSQGFRRRAGVELPRAGLRVVTVWDDTDEPEALQRYDIGQESVRIAPLE